MTEEKKETRAPVWYVANEKSVIDNVTVEAGDRVQYAGLPSSNLEPTDAEGKARRKEHDEADKARVAKLVADNQDSPIGDPDAFMKAFSKELAEQNAAATARFEAVVDLNNKLTQTLSDLVTKLQPAPAPIPGTVEAAVATDATATAAAAEEAAQSAKASKAKAAT